MHFPFPPAAVALTAKDTGRTVNVHVGELVEVTLLGSQAPNGRWPEIAESGAALTPLLNPANAATVGTQLGEYCAVKAGLATLSSGEWRLSIAVS